MPILYLYANSIPTSSANNDLFNGGSPEDVVVLLFVLWTVKVDSLTLCA